MSALKLNLEFQDPALEAEYSELQTRSNQQLEKQFHYARALTWLVVLLRALSSGERWATAVVALGLLSTLLPAFLQLLPRRQYMRWRLSAEVADNVLQVALGCFTHHQIVYNGPQAGGPSSFQMTAALLTGNGVAWLLFCSLWGSLPFRFALPQQAGLTIMLLLFNGQLCQRNAAMQLAYSTLALNASRRAQVALGRLDVLPAWQHLQRMYAAGRSCSAAVLAAPAKAREAVRVACMQAVAAAAAGTSSVARPAAEPSVEHGAQLCLRYQPVSLLLLGFLVPTLYIWTSEVRSRRHFLATRAADTPALRRAQQHLPTLADYFMFIVPALSAMYVFVVAAVPP